MCRFYSMSYRDVMDMPLRSFWSFNANVIRLRAEESLATMDLYLLGGMGVDGKIITEFRKLFADGMKEPIKAKVPLPVVDPEIHKEGIAKLRAIASRLKSSPR